MRLLSIATLFLVACLPDVPKHNDSETDVSVDTDTDGSTDTPTDTGAGTSIDTDTDTTPCTDCDGDGHTTDDCNDTNAAIHPGAVELRDWVDQDCDGSLGTWSVEDAPIQIVGEAASLGLSVVTGDVDGDGRDDVVVSTRYIDDDGLDGRVWVWATSESLHTLWPSSPQIWSTAAADRAVGGPDGSQFGRSSTVAPDLLQPGRDAIIARALWANGEGLSRAGDVYILDYDDFPSRVSDSKATLSAPSACLGADVLCVSGETSKLQFGYSACYWDGPDGTTPTLVVGAGGDNDVGYVYLLDAANLKGGSVASATGVMLAGSSTRHGSDSDRRLGSNGDLRWIPDVDGDGYDEYAIASSEAPWVSETNTDGPGYVYLVSGAALSGLWASPYSSVSDVLDYSIAYEGEEDGDRLGGNLNGGDLDDDGYGDLLLGAANANGTAGEDTGRIYALRGPLLDALGTTRRVNDAATAIWEGSDAGDYLSPASFVDPDGDGIEDMFITAPGANVDVNGDGVIEEAVGTITAIRRSDIFLGGTPANGYITFVGTAAGDGMDCRFADFDGDGRGDFVCDSASHDALGVSDSGQIWIMPGTLVW